MEADTYIHTDDGPMLVTEDDTFDVDGMPVVVPLSGGTEPATWLGTTAAAEYLGMTPRTLYRLIDEGQVVAYRFGRVIRLKHSDLLAYIEACRIAPGTLAHLYPEGGDAA